jgi:hypothetical protein
LTALANGRSTPATGLVHDIGPRPRYFRPRDAQLLDEMRRTRTAIGPGGRDFWSGVLGFNLSHGLGVLKFALNSMMQLITVDEPVTLVQQKDSIAS